MRETREWRFEGFAGLVRYVESLDEDRHYFRDVLDFDEVWTSSAADERDHGQRSAAFRAGRCVVVCSEPLRSDGPAGRYLALHPEGIGAIAIAVDDAQAAMADLEARGATPISDLRTTGVPGGEVRDFTITSPLPDVGFWFVERRSDGLGFPGVSLRSKAPNRGNPFRFQCFDHVTLNHQTMAPALLWFQHVLGLEPYWKVDFHTRDELPERSGSGLRSVVMWDPVSGIKFANNEPLRPDFHASQVAIFCAQQRGSGVQHVALLTSDLLRSVRELGKRGVRFVETPRSYYERLSAHLRRSGIDEIDEGIADLEELHVLVDGNGHRSYLLQIFMEDAARFSGDPKKSPFFFELIQRKGDTGFGAGNFRMLFEGVERTQRHGLQSR